MSSHAPTDHDRNHGQADGHPHGRGRDQGRGRARRAQDEAHEPALQIRDAGCAGHDPAHHGHAHAAGADEWRVACACLIIVAFLAVQVAGGVISGSLALLADAGHMASDAVALAMSWVALRIGRRPADRLRSYGYRRLEILIAFANGCGLFAITAWIAFEAAWRLASPRPVLAVPMLAVAITGLIANAVAFLILSGGRRENLNLRSAWLHVLGDLLGFAVTVVAAVVILLTGWSRVDPVLSLIVAALILRSALQIVRSSGHILLEGTPAGLDVASVRDDLIASLPGVCDVHHVHAWSLTQEQPFITLHVRATPGADIDSLVPAISRRLEIRFGITHSTIQVDHTECEDEHHA